MPARLQAASAFLAVPIAESQNDQVAAISRDRKEQRVLSHERRHTRPDRAASANTPLIESQTLKWTDL